jgi:hypothetical protein
MNNSNFLVLLFSSIFLLFCNQSQKSDLVKNNIPKSNILNPDQIEVICEVWKKFPRFGFNEFKTFLFSKTLLNKYSQDTVALSYHIEKDSSLFAYQYLIPIYYNENHKGKYDISKSSINSKGPNCITDDITFEDKSILFTSTPATDKKTGLAIIYVEISCGVRCGKSFFVFFKCTENQWIIFKMIELWEA